MDRAYDYRTLFDNDDCNGVKEVLQEYGPLTVLADAAIYSTRQKLSANMTRTILETTISEYDLDCALWILNEFINGADTSGEVVLGIEVAKTLQNALADPQDFGQEAVKAGQKSILLHIGLCSDGDFDELLKVIAKIALQIELPNNIMLATLERIKRRIKDDRVFFMSVNFGISTRALELLVTESQAAQAAIIEQLQDNGYTVEEVSEGGASAYLAHPPGSVTCSYGYTPGEYPDMGSSQVNPSSGTYWVSKHPRRGPNRRRH